MWFADCPPVVNPWVWDGTTLFKIGLAEPPVPPPPVLTTRNIRLSAASDVSRVHPVGALACAKGILVPDGNADGEAPVLAEVTRPFASTVTVAYVYVPAETPELASVPVPVTLAEPLKLPLV